MLAGIGGLYLLWARSLAPNRYKIQGMGAKAIEMNPKVETAQAPVKLVITMIEMIRRRLQDSLEGQSLTLNDHKGYDGCNNESERSCCSECRQCVSGWVRIK